MADLPEMEKPTPSTQQIPPQVSALRGTKPKTKPPAPKKKKKRSQAPVAMVYFVTLAVCLIVFGLIGLKLIDTFSISNTDSSSEDDTDSSETLTLHDTTLFFLMTDESGKAVNSALIRVLPNSEKITIIPFSPYTELTGGTIAEVYADNGIVSVKNALESQLAISIDQYMALTGTSFDAAVQITGGVLYTVSEDLYYDDPLTKDTVSYPKGTETALEGSQLRAIMNYPIFQDGASTNVKVTGSLLTDWINTSFEKADILTENLDDIFNAIYTDADTNITSVEYQDAKPAILYLINNLSMPANYLTPTGKWNNETSFSISSSFVDQLPEFLELDGETEDDS